MRPRSRRSRRARAKRPPSCSNPRGTASPPQQMAALDAQFSRTIARAQRSLTDVPPQKRPPARNPEQRRYEP